MSLRVATRRALLSVGGVTYLLRDEFDDTVAAGSVNGTAATPGPGTRVVTDTDGDALSVVGGKATFANPNNTWGDPGLWYDEVVTRTLGRLLCFSFLSDLTTTAALFGFDPNQAGNPTDGFHLNDDAGIYIRDNDSSVGSVATYVASTEYNCALVLRTSGLYAFIKGGTFAAWTLLWVAAAGSDATLYLAFSSRTMTGTLDSIRPPDRLFIPPVMVYDSFTRANGALGDSEVIGPDAVAQAEARTWESGGATWAIAGNEAVNTPTVGGEELTNGDFTAWVGDNPSGWDIEGVEDGANYVTENPGGQAQIVSDGTVIGISQVTLAANTWYTLSIDTTVVSGSIRWEQLVVGTIQTITSTGTHIATHFSPNTNGIAIKRATACDITVDNASVKPLTLNTLFTDVDDGETSDYLAEIELDTVVQYTQAGMVLNLDDKDTPANFIVAWHDGTRAKLYKCVAGSYTSVINAVATYSAGAKLVVIKQGTSYALFYNNAKIGSTSTVSDAGIISNTKHGLFSTSSGNQLDNFAVFYRTNAAYDTELDLV